MQNPYYTHRPYLIEILDSLGKDAKILEIGCGIGSSEIFHGFSKRNKGWEIFSVEDNGKWAKEMSGKFQTSNYEFLQVSSWRETDYSGLFPAVLFWDFVFVDNGVWEERIRAIDQLSSKTNIFLLHDYDFYNRGFCGDIFSVDSSSFFAKYLDKFELVPKCDLIPPTLVFNKK